MTVWELAELLQQDASALTLLDVRNEAERDYARIEPSLFIPLPELLHRVSELEPWRQRRLVVYCHHGVRSAYAIQILAQAGFSSLHNLEGGIDAWSAAIDPEVPVY